ncbi:MAG TPA: hypothetical protein VGA62_04325, partial [Acidimicrobiia bacterium]
MSRVEAPPRVCRVQPDVPAVHRAFDYLVPEALAREVRVGTMVRVPLHGRRVRGWVLEHDVVDSDVEVDRLQTIVAAVSAGPPAEVVALCRWAAWRWAGPLVTFLRAASPPNLVAAHDHAELETAVYPDAVGASSGVVADIVHALRTRSSSRHGVVEWPPGAPPEALTEALVAAEGSTIVVDPDPMRGARLLHTLRASGRDALSYSGDGSGAERAAAWSRARGGACVVVGGRLAIWAPVPDLTTIVVIDEGDEALEEERAPTWNARDVARERARRTETGIVMVTPAPTVDARYALGEPVVPARSFVRASWPRVEAIDLRREAPGHWLLTAALADALRRVRDGGGRSVCVLNRRGRARLLACVACGEATRCEACGATVVGHDEGLMCPRCDTVRPSICLQCHGSRLRAVKPGIARVRDDLAALLPRARVTAIDAGSDSIPDSDVLVGTEAVLHRAGSALGHAAGS